VSVVGGDVEGLNVATSAAGVVTGRVVVEGNAPLPSPLSKMTVRSLPVERDTAVNFGSIPDNGFASRDERHVRTQVSRGFGAPHRQSTR
jgi:hypothetical protein